MKKLLFWKFLFSIYLFANFDPNLCSTYIGDSVFSAKAHDTCVIDERLETWIKCRAYYEKNMMNGLNYQGEKKVQGNPTYMYDYFDKEIKKVLIAEVKKQIEKSHNIMCIKNTEDNLFKYQESIAEHEWCYAPKFLKAFNDEFMNEQEMKSNYFKKLYNTRNNMLESKEKPKNKEVLCGVYLECMSSFINANHTEVSRGLSTLYEKIKKECRSNYFVITTKTERKEVSRKDRGANTMVSGPKSLLSSWTITKISKQMMYVDGSSGNISLMPLKDGAHSDVSGTSYHFNSKSCSYEQKSKRSKDENLKYSMASLKRHNIGLANSDKAIIELEVRNSPFKKKFVIDWKTLQNSGSWSGYGSYHKRKSGGDLDLDIPEGMGELSGIANNIKGLVKTMREKVGPKSKEIVQTGIDNFGRSKKENCHQMRVHEGFFVNEKKTFSIDIEVDISIRDATRQEIDFIKNIADMEDMHSYRAREIKLSKFEKEPESLFDSLQNSVYDDMSQNDKKAWDRADREHKEAIQNKKDLKEFNNLSIDDLEMFTK